MNRHSNGSAEFQQRGVHLPGNPVYRRAGRLIGDPAYHRDTGLYDARLLGSNLLKRVAEVGLVIETDGRDDGAVAIQQVDGVEPAAEADFHDRVIQVLRAEDQEGSQRAELEIAQADLAAHRLDALEGVDELTVSGLAARVADPFVVFVEGCDTFPSALQTLRKWSEM